MSIQSPIRSQLASALERTVGVRRSEVQPWARPADWLALPVIGDTEEKFAGLYAIYNDETNYVALTAAGNFTVDWGDGSATENVASGVTAQHQYDYATLSSTVTTRGYKTVVVTVVPQAGQTLTSLNVQKRHSSLNGPTDSRLLDLSLTGPNLTTLSVSYPWSTGATVFMMMLENIRIGPNAITAWASMFYNCSGLRSVQRMECSAGTGFQHCFRSCVNLQYILPLDLSSSTQNGQMFQDCVQLQRVGLHRFRTTAGASVPCSSMFQGCINLPWVPKFDTSRVTTFSFMFAQCYSLQEVPLFDLSNVTSLSSMFINCTSLRKVPMLTMRSGINNLASMFEGCYSINDVSEAAWDMTGITDTNRMFYGCQSLTKQPPFINTSAITNPQAMFQNCSSLQAIDWTHSGSTNGSSMMSNDYNLSKLILTGYNGYVTLSSLTRLTKNALEAMAVALGTSPSGGAALQGASSPSGSQWVNVAGVTVTAGSRVATMASTTGLTVGAYVTGTGLGSFTATIDTAANTINRVAHDLTNGTQVGLTALATSTGIAIKTYYYVVNAAADTFQLALTPGGAAIDITGLNGTCTVMFPVQIASIVPNTSITMSVAAVTSGSGLTLATTAWNRYLALLKGFGVTQ